MEYVQIVNGVVNLVGGPEVGLCEERDEIVIQVLEKSKCPADVAEGMNYDYATLSFSWDPVIEIPVELSREETLQMQLDQIQQDQLTIMEALAELGGAL